MPLFRACYISSAQKKGLARFCDIPHGVSCQDTSSKEHSDIDRGGLDSTTDGHNHTHELHKPNSSEPVTDGSLRQCATRLASDIYRNDLRKKRSVKGDTTTQESTTYGTRESIGGLLHVINPALMSDCYPLPSAIRGSTEQKTRLGTNLS
jgi:hypothetical protein